MSMTVSTAGYFSGLYQNTRASGGEQSRQKDTGGEAGKTRQSAVSASLDQVNMGQDGIAVTEVSRQQGTERSPAQKQSPAPRTDTVEISAEGRDASARIREQSAGAVEQYAVEDLSEYTDTELKQMYYKGEITRQEYEEETGETLEQS